VSPRFLLLPTAVLAALALPLLATAETGEPRQVAVATFVERCTDGTDEQAVEAAAQADALVELGFEPGLLPTIAARIPDPCEYDTLRQAVLALATPDEWPRPATAHGLDLGPGPTPSSPSWRPGLRQAAGQVHTGVTASFAVVSLFGTAIPLVVMELGSYDRFNNPATNPVLMLLGLGAWAFPLASVGLHALVNAGMSHTVDQQVARASSPAELERQWTAASRLSGALSLASLGAVLGVFLPIAAAQGEGAFTWDRIGVFGWLLAAPTVLLSMAISYREMAWIAHDLADPQARRLRAWPRVALSPTGIVIRW